MKLTINDIEYDLKLNLKARIKLSKDYTDETKMFELAGQGDITTITKIIHASLQEYNFSYEDFLKSYPNIKESYEALIKIFQKLIAFAGNPFELNSQVDKREPIKTDFRELLINVMSKGYTQEEVLNMTYWDINLIFEADYKKLERETFHTNALINTMAGIMGSKETIDILGRKKKEEYRDYSIFERASELLNTKK